MVHIIRCKRLENKYFTKIIVCYSYVNLERVSLGSVGLAAVGFVSSLCIYIYFSARYGFDAISAVIGLIDVSEISSSMYIIVYTHCL